MPKTMIKIEDKPILGHILSNIKNCGIKDVLIVTGYRNDLIKKYVGSGSKFGLNVDYCHNEDYYKTENIVSVKMAEKDLEDDGFVLINADDLFSPVILERLIDAPGNIVLAVDGEGTVGTEEMKVSVNGDGRILAVSKQLDPEESFGEDIGVMKFSKEGGKAFFKAIDEIIQERGPHFYFQEALDHLTNQEYPITYVNIEDEPWIEIDDHFDLKWAKTPIIHMILERIRGMGRRIKSIRKKKPKNN
jgi:choline kinase